MAIEDQRIRSAVRTLVDSAPPAPPFPIARRRRRLVPPVRTVLAFATACIVGAGVLVVQSSRNGSHRVNTLAIAANDGAATGRFSLINLDSRQMRQVNVPGMGSWGNSQYPIVHTGSRLVYFEKSVIRHYPPAVRPKVYSYSDRFRGPVITLGRADVVVPSARSGYIWLVERYSDRFDVTVSEVSASSPAPHPRRWSIKGEPIIGIDGGLLVDVWNKNHDEIVVWRPDTPTRTLLSSAAVATTANDGTNSYGPGALLFGGLVGESAVVGTGCDQYQTCDELKIVNISSGEAHTLPRPRSVQRWVVAQDVSRDALSPSGKYIVIPVKPAGGGDFYPRIVVDLNGRVLRRFDQVAASVLWSDDGEWVIVQRMESLVAYRPSDGSTKTMRFHYNGPVPITLPGSLWQ